MKIPFRFAAELILILDLAAMTVSCEESQPKTAAVVQPSQPFVPENGQSCRDQIVSCGNTDISRPTCPYSGQKIEVITKGVAGCNDVNICVCRCPTALAPKPESQ